ASAAQLPYRRDFLMTASTLYLILSVIGLLFTVNALRPLPFEATSLFAFFAGWLTSELPIHHIVWQAVATAVFIAAGALSAPAGWIGLVITAISWAGLLYLTVQSQRSEAVFERALVDALGADYRGDPSFVAISGGSAGGHLAAMAALTSAPDEIDACVPLYGVYDFTNRDGLRGPGMTRFLLERQVMKLPFASNRAAYEAASPMDQIRDGERVPPFFVVHGSNDSLVPVQEARNFVRLLRAKSQAPVAFAE